MLIIKRILFAIMILVPILTTVAEEKESACNNITFLHDINVNDYDVIIIGEQHGNSDNIKSAICIMEYINNNSHKEVILAMEHLPSYLQEQIGSRWYQEYSSVDKLAVSIKWWELGWPNWLIYRDIFNFAYINNIALVALDDATIVTDKNMKQEFKDSYELAKEAWKQIINNYHNNDIEADKLTLLANLQMSRDINMANNLKNNMTNNNIAILYAGQDHARNDGSIKILLSEFNVLTIGLNCTILEQKFNYSVKKCRGS